MALNDYTLIGSFGEARFMPIERIPSGITNSVNEVYDLKNLDETDIDFMESLYRNSNPDYYMGGWIVKAVIDITLEFMCGKLPRVNANDDAYTKFCNKVWNANASKIYEAFRELGLFGQEWIYVGYDPRLKLPKYRPLCRRNVVDVRYENYDDPDDITYIRIRDTFEDYSKVGGKDLGDVYSVGDLDAMENTIVFDKIFWKELNPDYTMYISELSEESTTQSKRKRNKRAEPPDQWIYYMMILRRENTGSWEAFQDKRINPLGVIPVIEFNQNRLSIDKSGYSDVSGALRVIGVYHQTLETAVNNNLYNLQPTLKFTGIEENPLDFVRKMYGSTDLSSGDVLEQNGTYGVFGSYYLPKDMDVNWLSTPDHTGSSTDILSRLFYILVQTTGIPEWALGAQIQGAWATVRQQAVPLMQKIHAKRIDVNDELLKLCWVSSIVMQFHNQTENYTFTDTDAELVWDDILTRESTESLSIIEALLARNLITDETALSLVGVVSDPVKELEMVRQAKAKNVLGLDAGMANEQTQSRLVELFRRQQQSLLDDESTSDEIKNAATEILNLSDASIMRILNSMIDENVFNEQSNE